MKQPFTSGEAAGMTRNKPTEAFTTVEITIKQQGHPLVI
jgi:hypothetical protein